MPVRPVTFDGCAGALHPGRTAHGVVILGTLGSEGNVVHRGLFELAEMLSRDGASVLRYDLLGTGQSGADLRCEALLEAWVESVGRAVEWLRRCCGVTTVSVVGIRLGATIALLAQQRPQRLIRSTGFRAVDRIVSIAPVVRGKTYVRELRMLSAARPGAGSAGADTDRPPIDLAGEVVPEPLAADLAAIDLRRVQRGGPEILLVDVDRPDAAALQDRLASLGARVVRRGFPDGSDFLCDALDSTVPIATFDAIRAWLALVPSDGRAGGIALGAALLEGDRFVERHVSFGCGAGLHGVLALPRVSNSRSEVVVFVNTGLTRSSGDGRITVVLARALASAGIASLRIDVAGIGDSDRRPERSREVLYDRTATEDVGEAIELLRSEGFESVVLVGTCSGAYLALQSALADARIRAVVAINLQKFVWREGMSVRIDRARSHRTIRSYLRDLRSAAGCRHAAREWRRAVAVVSRAAQRTLVRAARLVQIGAGGRSGHPDPQAEARSLLATLSSRGQRVTLVYSEDDPGWAELTTLFGRRGRGLRHLAGISVRPIAGADHILTGSAPRAALREMIAAEAALLAVAGRSPDRIARGDRIPRDAASRREVAFAD